MGIGCKCRALKSNAFWQEIPHSRQPALPAVSKWLSGIADVLPKRKKQLLPGKITRSECYPVALCSRPAAVSPDLKSCTSRQHFWDWKEQQLPLICGRTVDLNASVAQLRERAQRLGYTDAIRERTQTRQDQGILTCCAMSDKEQK